MTRDLSRGSGTNGATMIQKIPDHQRRFATMTAAPLPEPTVASLSLLLAPNVVPELVRIPKYPPLKEDFDLAHFLPEFVRLPKSGTRCRWTGLSRSAICELILPARAPVKSVVLRRRGATRGQRLIHLRSLLDHLHAQAATDLSESDLTQNSTPTTSAQ
jgi:hypothetical protein